MKHTKMFAIAMSLSLLLGLAACGNTSTTTSAPSAPEPTTTSSQPEVSVPDPEPARVFDENPVVEIVVKDYGTITLELDAEAAPITVANFVSLAESGFYDGLTFHRIIPGFMIQGGDPLGTGMGGSDEKITGEFFSNGVENSISHKRGVISMARNGVDNNSASSQFFIVHEDSEFLDGDYAAFGYVTDGMDVVDAVAGATYNYSDANGGVPAAEQPVIESVRVITE